MRAFFIFLSIAVPSLSTASDLKINTVHRFSGTGSAQVSPHVEEVTEYIQGERKRSESRTQTTGPLWTQGPIVPYFEPHTAQIRRCDDDKLFELNLDDHTYQVGSFGGLSGKQIPMLGPRAPLPRAEAPTHPTVLNETTTVDTGERKQAFGYTARHVVMKWKTVALEGADRQSGNQASEGEGWYIDLSTRISCDPSFPPPREGITYAISQLRISGSAGQESVSNPQMVETKYIGKPETGLCIWAKSTTRRTIPRNGVNEEEITISETQVTELLVSHLDPGLFEVPRDFRPVDQIRYVPRISWWSYFRYWGHYYWVRFRKAL